MIFVTLENLPSLVNDTTKWVKIGSGVYNTAYVSVDDINISGYSYQGKWVLKKPESKIPSLTLLNKSDRAVRKWNTLNPNIPAIQIADNWIAPYLGKTAATDEQMADKLIDIYVRTRIIVGDAYASGNNFLMHEGEAICVDVDQAFRRGSVATDKFMANPGNMSNYAVFFSDGLKIYPKTVTVIRGLFYLEEQLQDKDIENKYIRSDLTILLNYLRDLEKPLNKTLLEKLLRFVVRIAEEGIKEQFITSQFVKKFLVLFQYEEITSDALRTLLKELIFITASDLVKSGNLNELKQLVQHHRILLHVYNSEGYTLFQLAAKYGQLELVSYLDKEGAAIYAVTNVNSEPLDSNCTALDLAIIYLKDAVALYLMERGVKSSTAHRHIIHSAATQGRLDLVQTLIERDSKLIDITDHHNQTPLLWAAAKGQLAIVKYLHAKGAQLNIATKAAKREENSFTPLDWAILGKHNGVALWLTGVGATANVYIMESRSLKTQHLSQLSMFKSAVTSNVRAASIDEKTDKILSDAPF